MKNQLNSCQDVIHTTHWVGILALIVLQYLTCFFNWAAEEGKTTMMISGRLFPPAFLARSLRA